MRVSFLSVPPVTPVVRSVSSGHEDARDTGENRGLEYEAFFLCIATPRKRIKANELCYRRKGRFSPLGQGA